MSHPIPEDPRTNYCAMILLHTEDAQKSLDNPETVRRIIGDAFDSLQKNYDHAPAKIEEEIDYTLDVYRTESDKDVTTHRIAALAAELREAKRGPCCREPWCEGECTCEICAPDLALRDLKAALREAKQENAELQKHWDESSRIQDIALGQRDDALKQVARLSAPVSEPELRAHFFEADSGGFFLCNLEAAEKLIAARLKEEQ